MLSAQPASAVQTYSFVLRVRHHTRLPVCPAALCQAYRNRRQPLRCRASRVPEGASYMPLCSRCCNAVTACRRLAWIRMHSCA